MSLFKESNPEATELDIIKEAFLNVTESFLNCGAIKKHRPKVEKVPFEILPSTFVFDNVDNLQETVINEAFKEYPYKTPQITVGWIKCNYRGA